MKGNIILTKKLLNNDEAKPLRGRISLNLL